MSRYNHFAPLAYGSINFNDLKHGQRFRIAKFKGKRRRYLIMVKTGDLAYMELKSKTEHKLYNSDITVYSMNNNNTEIPVDLSREIIKQAQEYTKDYIYNNDWVDTAHCSYIEGATAWAPWKVKYDQLSAENSVLQQKNIQIESRLSVCEKEVYDHRNEYQELQAQTQAMADALELVLRNWDDAKLNAVKRDKKVYTDNADIAIAKERLQQFKDGKGKEVKNA